jgi:hypothetical protein
VQTPIEHVEFGPQFLPQAPQLFVSFVRSVQVFLQTTSPAGQALHLLPERHWDPTGQTKPPFSAQAPQLLGSDETSEQPLTHVTSPGAHWQTLFVQVAPLRHALPHAAQLALLLVRSTQTPLQSV